MPQLLTREEAIDAVLEMVPTGDCSMCWVLEREQPLATNEAAVMTLNAFPLRWGHILITLRRHVTAFSQLSDDEHALATKLVHDAARRIETALKPPRVFTASLGCSIEGLRVTTPHLHWHVVPIANEDERPVDVFTWQHGILRGSPGEWAELRERLSSLTATRR